MERGKEEDLRLGTERPGLFPGMFDLALFQGSMFRTEAHGHALRFLFRGLANSMEVACS